MNEIEMAEVSTEKGHIVSMLRFCTMHFIYEIASIARAFLHHCLEAYPVDSIALRVSN